MADERFKAWLPAGEATRMTLRPMPWELDRSGAPTARFWAQLIRLGAGGWIGQSGMVLLPEGSRPPPVMAGEAPALVLRAFARLDVVTRFAGSEAEGLALEHALYDAAGQLLARAASRVRDGELAVAEIPAARFASGPVTGTALPDMLARAA